MINSMQKILITGASGFIGKDLLNQLDFDCYEVFVLTRSPEKFKEFDARIHVVEGDLTDKSSLVNALNGIDIVINLAAEVRDIAKMQTTNIDGSKNLIEAMIQNNVLKIIHLSSVGVVGKAYSAKELKVNEEVIPTPANEYERTKLISEQLFIEAFQDQKFELTVLRPTNVFGEGHPFNALLNLMQKIQNGKLLIYSEDARVNYVYVRDLTNFIIQFLEEKKFNGVYTVGYGMKLVDFYTLIMDSMNMKTRLIKIPQFPISFANSVGINKLQPISNKVIYDDSKLQSLFSYKFGMEKGIQKTVSYFKEKNLLK